MVIGSAGATAEHRVVQFGLGADPADLAVSQLRRGKPIRVITDRTLLRRRIRGVLASTAGKRPWRMLSYHELVQQLWNDVYNCGPDGFGKYDAEWQAFWEMLSGHNVPPIERTALVILEGQRIPSEFYRVVVNLGISAVVGVDPSAPVTEQGSTTAEIVAAFGNVPLEHYSGSVPGTGVLDLIAAVDPAGRPVPAGAADRGPLPVVRGFDSADDETWMVAKLASDNPGKQFGVLLPTVELIDAFAKRLREIGVRFQWYHHSHSQQHAERIDFDSGGIKLLSWASSAGLRFDHVVLPQLQHVDEQYLAKYLPLLGVTAWRELSFSYTGDGLPTALASLPRHLLDLTDVTGDAEGGAPFHGDLSVVTGQVLTLESGPARAVLREDRVAPALRHRVLTAQEEVSLAALMRGEQIPLSEELPAGYRASLPAGDLRAAAFDAMVTHNLGLVRKYAANYSTAHWDLEDLLQIGVIGLMRAIEKFDASMGLKFSTYATWWINQAIGRAMPEGLPIRIPVHMWELVRKVAAVRSRLTTSDRPPTVDEIAAVAQVPVDKVVQCLEILSGVRSLDEPVRGETDLSLWDVVVSDAERGFDELIDHREVVARVHGALRQLGDREANILRLRFGFDGEEPMTLDRIGERYSVTRERIRQIEAKSKSRLRDYLRGGTPVRPTRSRRGRPRRRNVPPPAPATRMMRADIDPTTLPPVVEESAADSLVRFIVEQVVHSATTSLTVVIGTDEVWCGISYPGFGSSVHAVLGDRDAANTDIGAQALRGLMRGIGALTTWVSDLPEGVSLRVEQDRWSTSRIPSAAPSALPFRAQGTSTTIRMSAPGSVLADSTGLAGRISAGLGVALAPRIRDQGLLIAVNGELVPAVDPFLWANPATQDLGEETISAGGCVLTANPYVLPHPTRLRAGDVVHVGDPAAWPAHQGLYLRSDGRYLLWGGWWGLPGFEEDETSSLVRIDLDIDADQLALWGFGGPGPIGPPAEVAPRLAAVASVARKRSEAVWKSHRKDSA